MPELRSKLTGRSEAGARVESWRLHIVEDDAGLAADELPVALAVTAADGSVRRANMILSELLGPTLPDGPEALVGLLLAAGVPEPGERLEASVLQPQDLVLRRGGGERPVRLATRTLSGGDRLHLFHDLRDARAGQGRLAELQSLIAHDLRSPLAVIQGYAGLLATGQPGPLNATQAEFLAGIDTKIVEVTRLLDDFLDLSRLEAGALQLRPQPVRVGELVTRVCDELSCAAAARRIDVSARTDPVDLQVTADPLRLKQVIENLIGNAVKYNHDGGWVRVEVSLADADLRVEVRDGGPGMEPAELSAAFEPFARGKSGAGAAGSGLGLAVVQRLVSLHHGSITADSAPGKGSTFTVTLPGGCGGSDPADSTDVPIRGAVQ